MKNINKILIVFTAILSILSCTKDVPFGSTDFVKSAQEPSNLSALFDVLTDNSGTVNITPSGDNVNYFGILFGDQSADTTFVQIGESATNIYAEGSYDVSIIGINSAGKMAVQIQKLELSLKAPENVEVTIENDIAISKQVNVVATADYGLAYDVYFGEEGMDDPVSANIGETASYVYKEAGTYSIRVVVKSAAAETVEVIKEHTSVAIVQPTSSAPTPPARNDGTYISVFSDAYTDVEGTNFNPDWGQSSQGSSYAEFDLNGDKMQQYINLSYQGIALADGTKLDVSGMDYLHMDVWTADVTVLETSLINGEDGNSTEKPVNRDLTADQWTSIDIPISEYTDQGLTVNEIFQLKLVGTPWAGGTVFVDNIYFYKDSQVASEPVALAPIPSYPAGDVISIFSNAYSNVAVSEWNPGWGQSTTLTELQILGNDVLKYENLNFTGIVTNYDNPTDVSSTTHVHFDYWTPDATSLGLKLVNTTHGDGDPLKESEISVSSVELGKWVSVDIPLSSYTTDISGITQMLFVSSEATVYIDNLFFYKDSGNGGGDTGSDKVELPLTFEGSATYTWEGFGDAGFGPIPTAIAVNPSKTGINTSDNVVEIKKTSGAQTWAGASILLDNSIDFSSTTTIKVKVYSAKSGAEVLLKIEDSTAPKDANNSSTIFAEVKATTSTSGAWEELTFDMSGFGSFSTSNSYDTVVLFPDFGQSGADDTYYFDDIVLNN